MKLILIILLFITGVLSRENNTPKIIVDESQIVPFRDAALSKDENTLYTLHGKNTITKWHLNPIARVESFEVSDKKVFRIMLLPDEKGLIVRIGKDKEDKYKLSVWNFKDKSVIGKICNETKIMHAVIDNIDLITFDYRQNIKRWDTSTLKVLKSIKLSNSCGNECTTSPLALILSKDKKILVAIQENILTLLDSKTLEIIKSSDNAPKRYFVGNNPNKIYYKDDNRTEYISDKGSYIMNIEKGIEIQNNWFHNNLDLKEVTWSGTMKPFRLYSGLNFVVKVKPEIRFLR